MGTGSWQGWESFSRQRRREITALIEQRSGDHALAEEVAREVLETARLQVEGASGETPSRLALEVAALRLAIRRLHERRQPVPPSLGAGVHALSWPADHAPPDDPELVAIALARLPARDRIALNLRYIDDYSIDDAANFFEISRGKFLRLLSGARRRLLEEYERLRDGAGALVALLVERALGARRRAHVSLARTHGALHEGLARLSCLPVLEACSTAVTLAVVAALALGPRGAPVREPHVAPSPPAALRVVLAAARSEPVPPRAATLVEAPAPAPSTPSPTAPEASPPPVPSLPPVLARPALAVEPLSKETGPEGRTTYNAESETLVEFHYEVPVAAPKDPSASLPDAPVGVSVEVSYHCPPPGERPPPQELACPVLEP